MNIWFWCVFALLIIAVILLGVKVYLFRRSAREIQRAFSQRLHTETNTLIDISSRDAALCALAASINDQLRLLRQERQKFQQGDLELKTAVTNISHDLRTPLTAICGYLELLAKEPLSPQGAEYLSILQERTQTMRQLTEELFRYSVAASPQRPLHFQPVVLNQMVEESLASHYVAFKHKSIRPLVCLPEEPVVRNLDRESLSRIFSNLLSNALKYSDGDLEITLSPEGQLSFTNTASQLDTLQVEQLFDRFYTVSSARHSTGLGLSIARTLTEQMGGTLTASFQEQKLTLLLSFPKK